MATLLIVFFLAHVAFTQAFTAVPAPKQESHLRRRRDGAGKPLQAAFKSGKASTARKAAGRQSAKKGKNEFDATPELPALGSSATAAATRPSGAEDSSNNMEMMAMAAAGAALAVGVVFILGSDGDLGILTADKGSEREIRALEGVAENIAEAFLPGSAANVVSVSLADGLAGVIGAAASFGIRVALRGQERQGGDGRMSGAVAVADGDYFLARAAALPLLEATGIPPFLASLTSVLFATLPYELVKIAAQKRRELVEENRELQRLLLQEQMKRDDTLSSMRQSLALRKEKASSTESVVDLQSLIPVRKEQDDAIDYVEVISDAMKWLEYDVLTSSYGGKLSWNGFPLVTSAESAIFGALACLSSKIYADILYTFFGLGGEAKRQKVQSRTFSDWSALYLSECISAATLFGVYAGLQRPVKRIVAALLSEGAGSCVGSDDYDLCVDTYLTANPLDASPAAEARALMTSLVSLWNQLYLFKASPAADVRALATAFYSLWNHVGGFHFPS